MIISSISYSQLNISTDYREDETWDGEEWVPYSSNNENTFFEFEDTLQSKMGMFVHRTNDITSAYLIKSYSYSEEYDMDEFVTKIVNSTKKYAYITAYRGFFPDLKKHKMNWNDVDGSYYNDFSIIQIKKKFKEIGLNENEFNVRSLKVDNKNNNLDYQTIIEIEKQ